MLDAADALGLLVWEEITGWGLRRQTLASASWLAAQLESLDAMIDTSFNHPSVVFFGLPNEADTSSQQAVKAFRQLSFDLITIQSPCLPI